MEEKLKQADVGLKLAVGMDGIKRGDEKPRVVKVAGL